MDLKTDKDAEDRQPKLLKDYRPPFHLISEVKLDVSLAPNEVRVASSLSIDPNGAGRTLQLDCEFTAIESIRLDGRPLSRGEYEPGRSGILIPDTPDRNFLLEIAAVCDPEANTELSGLYRTNGIYCTQCEPEGFRRITPFIDRPDVLSVYTVRIEADRSTPVLLSNGNPVASSDLPGSNRHFAVWHDPFPKPSYLFALVGGDLSHIADTFTTASGREVALKIYVEPGKEDRCEWAMQCLKESMRWDEIRFGREYDLDVFNIVAVSDFNMGAMENKGLNIFNDKLLLARPETASDADYASIEGVIAHEYFHNWSGDRITCRDWFQLCLKEGLTVFRDQEFSNDIRFGPVKRILDVRMLKTHQFPEDSGPLAHPARPDSYIEINNFYTATVYEKGAELCRMLQTLLGREGFRQGLDLYFERHDGQAVTVEDFLAAMQDANGRDLSQFMRWYTQAGTPEIACSLDYDPHGRTAKLSVTQITAPTPGQPKKEPQLIPLRLGLIGQNGDDLPLVLEDGTELVDGLLQLTEREHQFVFRDIASASVPSLLRDFSAPVRLNMSLDEGQIEFLMANDSDPFNRWQAAQTFANMLLTRAARDAGGTAPAMGAPAIRFAQALGATLRDETLQPAYRAEFMRLPSESDIARELGRNVDPDKVRSSRQKLRKTIGTEIKPLLEHVYESLQSNEPFDPGAEGAGRRALRNAALDLLVATGEEAEIGRAFRHFSGARNMTDSIAALALLAPLDTEEREEALAAFYASWNDEPLVLDKWFTVQAMSARPDAVETVEALLGHPKFSLKNPNRVRALLGAFANLNPTGFNRVDGAGYALFADTCLKIDSFNPHLAARLLGAFKSWRMFDPTRQALAQAALERLVAQRLSRDSYEIVSKTLG
jgi:aminopeptidase N